MPAVGMKAATHSQGLLGSRPCSATNWLWNATQATYFPLEILADFWRPRALHFFHHFNSDLFISSSHFHQKTCWKTVSVRLPSNPRGCFGIECIFVCLKSVNQTSFHLCKFSGLGGWFALYSNVHTIETCLFLELQPCDAPTQAKERKGVPAAPATDQCWTGLCHHL